MTSTVGIAAMRESEGPADLDQPDRVDLRLDQGLKYRGEFDGTADVVVFADALERVCVETVEVGEMAKALVNLIDPNHPR